ncbi:CBS domain-containing protein [Peribacillus sp. SCS-155]|uniref:CBS domain-containing protein n=1 Tax=Peribacillus sedimenti TaxID=3115297 RepID=UPI0039063E0E
MADNTVLKQSERFEAAFNRIHKVLIQSVKNAKSDKFSDLVYKGKRHALIRYYEPDLSQFAKLRNAIVHEKIDLDYYIAEPHIDIVEKIESIAAEFEKPQSALSIATKPVYYFYENDKLTDVLAVIKAHSHSRFPIYDKEDKYSWLLTSSEIVQWLAEHFSDDDMALKEVEIKDLYNQSLKHNVVFAAQNSTVLDIEDIFEEYHSKNEKIEGILITKSGESSEKPNGIITSWDIVEAELSE